ncbi:MAG: serpin family protein [Gemmatimonadaceae bacterium]
MSLLRPYIAVAFLAASVACSNPTSSGGKPAEITVLPRQLSPSEQAIATATSGFAFSLLQEVNRNAADSNVFISPLSASMALGMALNGAATETHDEMRTALGIGGRPLAELNGGYKALIELLRGLDKTVDFRIANAVWYRDIFAPSIAPSFLADAKEFFDAKVTGLNFESPQAVTTVNDWVNTGTNGKIAKILDDIPSNVVMYLMNAIYFKGAWRQPFDPKQTADASFTDHRGNRIDVKMMTRKGGFRLRSGADGTVVELPYGGDAFVMTILLPPEGTDINAFVSTLTPGRWQAATSGLAESSFDLYVPKFKLTWSDGLNDELKSMGMRRAFVPDGADFTRLSPTMGRNLYITDVRQKTFVDVNEEGTEAAAVTSVGVGVTSLPPSVRLDRPFVFAIRERLSGVILFVGKIVRPKTA